MRAMVVGGPFRWEAEFAVTAARRGFPAPLAAEGDRTGVLIIAVFLGLGTRQLPRALGELRRRHPHLQVTIHEEPDPTDMERLARPGTPDKGLGDEIPPGCAVDPHTLGRGASPPRLPVRPPPIRPGRAPAPREL